MSTPQITAVPAATRQPATGRNAPSEGTAGSDTGSFSQHLNQADSARLDGRSQGSQVTESPGVSSPKGRTANDAGSPQATASEPGEEGGSLQQLGERIASGEEVAITSSLTLELTPVAVGPIAAQPLAETGVAQLSAQVGDDLPLGGQVLPPQGGVARAVSAESLLAANSAALASGNHNGLAAGQAADHVTQLNSAQLTTAQLAPGQLNSGKQLLADGAVNNTGPGFTSNISAGLTAGLNPDLNSGSNFNLNSGLNSGLNSAVGPELASSANGNFNSALNSAALNLAASGESSGQNGAGLINSLASSPLSSVTGSQAAATGSPTGDVSGQRPIISLNTPLGSPGWTQEVGGRLQVLVERGNPRAEIRLNPPELGSIEVRVQSDNERTSVTFFAQNATTREALESALPRLREMFGDSGLQLADANVSQQQNMGSDGRSEGESGGGYMGDADTLADQEVVAQSVTQTANGLVDTYI